MRLRTPFRLSALALFAAIVLAPGCAKTTEDNVIKQDGSGVVTLTMVLEMEKIEALKMMAESMGGGQTPDGKDPFEELDMDKRTAELSKRKGIKVLAVDSSENDEDRTATHVMKLAFESLEALYRSGAVANANVSLTKRDDGNYELSRGTAQQEGMPQGEEAEMMIQGFLGMMQPYLDTLEVKMRITLPTAIVETNGTQVEGTNTVEWTVTFDTLAKFAAGGKQTVVFSGEGLDWKPFQLTAQEIAEALAAEDAAEAEPAAPVTPSEPDDGTGGEDDGMGGDDDGMGGGD